MATKTVVGERSSNSECQNALPLYMIIMNKCHDLVDLYLTIMNNIVSDNMGQHISGNFFILEVIFALFLDKKNMSSYLGTLVHCYMKIFKISSTYILF